MCLPTAAIAGIMAATAITQSLAAIGASKAQQAEYTARAVYNRRQAHAELLKGQYEAERLRDKGARLQGRQRALFSQAGVTLEGTPEEVVLDSVVENELDIQAVKWGQKIAAQNYEYEAKIDLMNKKSAKTAGFFAAVAPLLSGSTKIAGLYG